MLSSFIALSPSLLFKAGCIWVSRLSYGLRLSDFAFSIWFFASLSIRFLSCFRISLSRLRLGVLGLSAWCSTSFWLILPLLFFLLLLFGVILVWLPVDCRLFVLYLAALIFLVLRFFTRWGFLVLLLLCLHLSLCWLAAWFTAVWRSFIFCSALRLTFCGSFGSFTFLFFFGLWFGLFAVLNLLGFLLLRLGRGLGGKDFSGNFFALILLSLDF